MSMASERENLLIGGYLDQLKFLIQRQLGGWLIEDSFLRLGVSSACLLVETSCIGEASDGLFFRFAFVGVGGYPA